MNLYAESSAVLSWLLGEPEGRLAYDALVSASHVGASVLTIVEVRRVLHRRLALGGCTPDEYRLDVQRLLTATSGWIRLQLTDEIIDRSSQPFPIEPVRTLDALHLSSALVLRTALSNLRVLSFDSRVRENAIALGLPLEPPPSS